MQQTVAAVFNNHAQAEDAAADLRRLGVSDQSISLIARHEGETTTTDGAGEKAGDAVKGALGFGALGAGLGVAALAIPGVGPLVGAGAIAASAIPGALAGGAAIGAVGGGLTGLMTKHGVDEHDARYFEQQINQGGIFLAVDTSRDGVEPGMVRDVLERHGGHRSEAGQSGSTGMGASQSM